jgi:hypothetical protein
VIPDLAGGRRETLPRRPRASRVRLDVSDGLPRLALIHVGRSCRQRSPLSVQKASSTSQRRRLKSYPSHDNFRLSPGQKDSAAPNLLSARSGIVQRWGRDVQSRKNCSCRVEVSSRGMMAWACSSSAAMVGKTR